MNQQQSPKISLKVGDEIGFTILAGGLDESDRTIFLPVVEVTRIEGELAYRCKFPDGEVQKGAVRQSALIGHSIKIKPQSVDGMICLLDRVAEFAEAVKRGSASNLKVYADWERDTYVVVNSDTRKEYRVNLKTVSGYTFADCDCADCTFRQRICKHIAEVLIYGMFKSSGN